MEQLRLACGYSKILRDREALYTIANFDNVLEMKQFRIDYICFYKKTFNSLSSRVTLESSAQFQDNSNGEIRAQKRFNYHAKKSILSQIKIANDLLQQKSVWKNDVNILNSNLIKDVEYDSEFSNKRKK